MFDACETQMGVLFWQDSPWMQEGFPQQLCRGNECSANTQSAFAYFACYCLPGCNLTLPSCCMFACCLAYHAAAQVIVVNGKPSPTVRATVGDRIIIKVINKLQEPLSIHW